VKKVITKDDATKFLRKKILSSHYRFSKKFFSRKKFLYKSCFFWQVKHVKTSDMQKCRYAKIDADHDKHVKHMT